MMLIIISSSLHDLAIAHKEFDVKPATDELIDIAVIEVGHASLT